MGVRRMGKGGAQKRFRRAIIRGCIKCADTKGKSAVDYGGRGEQEWIGVVLGVEGCGATDQRGENA